ncbi:MAG TPA: hypothetical protein VFW45_10460 [Candidatus Polarisedimenticolia bacterium]|nr:hypothetical protein [Candidatus Polarisedimenticolia bacterium]
MAILVTTLAAFQTAIAAPVAVRYAEGVVHGFLTLHTLSGTHLADGELIQFAQGSQVTSRLVFHFQDGSIHDETSVYSQRRYFRLITNHLIQKGPTFKQPIEVWIHRASGRVKVRYEDDGKEKVEEERLDLPSDLANGMFNVLLKNLPPGAPPHTLSMVAASPKPRVVKINLHASREEPFLTGEVTRKAIHYVLEVDIPGLAGVIAPLVGKKPPDSNVWILPGETPAFIKSESLMYADGPLLRMELVSPAWPSKPPAR